MAEFDYSTRHRRWFALSLLPLALHVLPALAAFAPGSSLQPRRSDYGSLSAVLGQQRYYSRVTFLRNSMNDEEEGQERAIEKVFMDNGGSDLSSRFNYKVNALMGVFDPQTGADDEHQTGNIMSAMLKFPCRYSFTVVGRTNGDANQRDDYAQQVKSIVSSLSGDENGIESRITPRGKNFTRVQLQATVDSVAIINSINEGLNELEQTVMQF